MHAHPMREEISEANPVMLTYPTPHHLTINISCYFISLDHACPCIGSTTYWGGAYTWYREMTTPATHSTSQSVKGEEIPQATPWWNEVCHTLLTRIPTLSKLFQPGSCVHHAQRRGRYACLSPRYCWKGKMFAVCTANMAKFVHFTSGGKSETPSSLCMIIILGWSENAWECSMSHGPVGKGEADVSELTQLDAESTIVTMLDGALCQWLQSLFHCWIRFWLDFLCLNGLISTSTIIFFLGFSFLVNGVGNGSWQIELWDIMQPRLHGPRLKCRSMERWCGHINLFCNHWFSENYTKLQ